MMHKTRPAGPERAAQTRVCQLAQLAELEQMALGGAQLHAVAGRAARVVASELEVELAGVFELRPGDRALVLRAGVGWEPSQVGTVEVPATPESPPGYAIVHREPVVVDDLTAGRFQESSLLLGYGVRSGLAVPVQNGRVFGVLAAFTKARRDFTTEDVEFAESVARVLAALCERRHAEAASIGSQEILRALPAAVYTQPPPPPLRGPIWVSESIARLTGFPPRRILGDLAFWHSRLHPDDRPRVVHDLEAIGEQGWASVEYRWQHADGSWRWFLDHQVLAQNPATEGAEVIGSLIDITERKQTEEALRATNRSLEQALVDLERAERQVRAQERLNALGQLAFTMARDFNNVLTPVLGYSDLLLTSPENLRDTERVGEFLGLIRSAAQDAAALIRRLNDFCPSECDQARFEAVDVNAVVRDVVDHSRPERAGSSGPKIEVETELPEIPPVLGDAVALQSALTRLLTNAVEAMAAGGKVTLRTRCTDGHVVVEVADQGVGMTEEARRRCGELFYTTKGAARPGLGLSHAEAIVLRHFGTMEFASAPGQGTTVAVRLPAWRERRPGEDGAAGERGAPGDQPGGAPGGSLRVLVIDDDERSRKVLCKMLTVDGHRVEAASAGPEGVDKFRAGFFDLVISDYSMPGMNGDEVARAIRALKPDQPIAMLTAFGDLVLARFRQSAEVSLVICKPVTMSAVRAAVARLVPAAAGAAAPRDGVPGDALASGSGAARDVGP